MGALTGNSANRLAGGCVAKKAHEFDHIAREVIRARKVAAQRPRGCLIGAGCAAQPKVDAVRIERGQCSELFGNHQRCVVGQHDAPRTDANGRCSRGDMPDDHRGRGTGNARHIVMLGQPVAGKAPSFSMLRQIERIGQGVCR